MFCDDVLDLPEGVAVEPASDPEAAVSASSTFGLSLFQRLGAQDGNLVCSPASIALALSMAYAGAREQTADEMGATLAVQDAEAHHGAWATILHRWEGARGVELAITNRLFVDEQITIEPAYRSLVASRYGAPLAPVDFAGDPERQRRRINAWVARQTKGRIRGLLPPGSLDAATRMTLVNGIHFKAAWAHDFSPTNTVDAPFSAPYGRVDVPMMRQWSFAEYAEVDGVQILQKRYAGGEGDFATLFALPAATDRLADIEAQLDVDLLERWASALTWEDVSILLPRFEIEPGASVALVPELRSLGMSLPFQPERADFTGIGRPMVPDESLYIAEVYHKAYVAMDEAGTEAAVATAVDMGVGSAQSDKPDKEFNANRPFLFFLWDAATGLIVLAGRVVDPSAS